MYRHAFAKGRDAFGKASAGELAEPAGPLLERFPRGPVEAREFFRREFLGERDGRQTRAMENLVGPRIPDAAQQTRVRECALQSVVAQREARGEFGERRRERLETAGVERDKTRFALHHVNRGSLLGSGFGQRERTCGKIERDESAPSIGLGALGRGMPMEPSGDHQMQHHPDSTVHAERDALADAAQRGDRASLDQGQRRLDGTDEKRAAEANALHGLAQDARGERLEIDGDIR